MSTPPFLDRPDGVDDRRVSTLRGEVAVLHALPSPLDRPAPLAVLLPGFTGSKEDFIAVLAPLAAGGVEVVAADLRGQFETPAGVEPDLSLEGFAADVLALVAELTAGAPERPVHLLGHSLGGLVARRAVLAAPGRFASLTLLCSGPAAFSGPPAELLLRMADGIERAGLAEMWVRKRAHDIANGWVPPTDPDIDAFLEHRFVSNDPAALAAKARLLTTEPDRTDELRDLLDAGSGPRLLVVWGEHDDAWPPQLQQGMASRLGADTVVIREAGHSPAAERPADTVRVLLGFWRGSQPADPAAAG